MLSILTRLQLLLVAGKTYPKEYISNGTRRGLVHPSNRLYLAYYIHFPLPPNMSIFLHSRPPVIYSISTIIYLTTEQPQPSRVENVKDIPPTEQNILPIEHHGHGGLDSYSETSNLTFGHCGQGNCPPKLSHVKAFHSLMLQLR